MHAIRSMCYKEGRGLTCALKAAKEVRYHEAMDMMCLLCWKSETFSNASALCARLSHAGSVGRRVSLKHIE